MRSLRSVRTGTVAGVIAWKLTALALLPAALCCRAAMPTDGRESLPCCEAGHPGAVCPMSMSPNRAADAAGHPDPDQPRMLGCNSLDDALIGLVSLTGFTPDAFTLAADPAVAGRIVPSHDAASSFAGVPHTPPPRV